MSLGMGGEIAGMMPPDRCTPAIPWEYLQVLIAAEPRHTAGTAVVADPVLQEDQEWRIPQASRTSRGPEQY